MKVVPLTIKAANQIVLEHHRHNRPTQGGRFAIGALEGDRLVGVAIVGRTTARLLHDDLTAEVTRLCVIPGAPDNACSFLYGACRRIWQAMGGRKLVTYTLEKESGSSLKAAGWFPTSRVAPGAQWDRAGRSRDHQEVFAEAKIRWDAPISDVL